MFLPDNPILFPKPKFVKCPKCNDTWYWRTWYKGSRTTACSNCKFKVVPQEIPGNKARLIRCPKCHRLQWYTGDKPRTTCTKKDCKRRNMIVQVATKDELCKILKSFLNGLNSSETEKYYLDRIKEHS